MLRRPSTALIAMSCAAVMVAGFGCASSSRPTVGELATDSLMTLLPFAYRLDAQARAYRRDTGRWPERGSDLQGAYAAALEPVPPAADLGLIRFHPRPGSILILEMPATARATPDDVLYVGSDGRRMWQANAEDARHD